MVHPFTLPIVRGQGCFHCSHTLACAHRHPCAIGTPWNVSKSLLARDFRSVDQVGSSPLDRARLLAATAAQGSEWIFALPITACGLRLSYETIRVAIGLRLALSLCEPHPSPCGIVVHARGLHGLSCKRSAGRFTHHQQLNDVIWRALRQADKPAIKEPLGLIPGSDLHLDGLTLIPWQEVRCSMWYATVVGTLAMLYLSTSSTDVGSAAEAATERKTAKY